VSANCKVTYDDCTTFIYKQMIRLHSETYGMTAEGEPVWNICAQPKIITKPGMMENEEVTVIKVGTGKDEITAKILLGADGVDESGKVRTRRPYYDPELRQSVQWGRAQVQVQAGSKPVTMDIGFVATCSGRHGGLWAPEAWLGGRARV
jgi:hypothetical protein